MATTDNFNEMLKEYMPHELLVESMKKRNYFWNKVSKKEDWKKGTYYVPFEGGEYSSLSMGALTASNDVANGTFVKGQITTQPELWGTMKFDEKDLDRHESLEKSFLALVPEKVDQFVRRMQERVSIMLLGDGSIAKLTSDGLNGSCVVDHPERFTIGEKIEVDDDNSSVQLCYVTAINMSTKTLTVKDARSSGSAVNLTAYTTAQNAKIYLPGGQAAGFSGLKAQLLSAANGGGSTLYGQTKTTYPYLQSQQFDGSVITAANILEKLFDFYYETMNLGKGNPTEILMSMNNFKNAVKGEQVNRQYVSTDKKAGYGYRSVTLLGNEGEMTLTGIRDMADSEIYVLDWEGFHFVGDKFFDRKRHLDGNEYFLERATTGYSYLTDIKFYGDLAVYRPSHQGVIYGISY